ncbi:Exocyst subunit Exo70 family protein [Quillaja saponaria]|uniref:Exocyst subunit Exo70 family protein n=1 Tax=Quillaja saponaria TaxID=32244 RepID=A0AAD7VD25_QUISA|nr:Exocyst subunit Exo70 family protein [Quillaja saponaria]
MELSGTPFNDTLNPRKGMTSTSSSSKIFSSSFSFPSSPIPSPPTHTFDESMMEENIENAESIIKRWDLNSNTYTKVTSIFQHSRTEANEFLKSVRYLRQAMHFLVSKNATSKKLVLSQNLMQIAMKRLEKEFHQILSANSNHLDPESVSSLSSRGSGNEDDAVSEEESKNLGDSIADVERVSTLTMSDLKSIADCMISCGYGKECFKIYKIIRKSIVDEGLHHLGIERFKSSQIHKMNWETLEPVMNNWLNAMKIALRTLFTGERILCDLVFSASQRTKESCFLEITREGASNLFRFPELVTKSKHSPENIYRLMELYEAISDIWPVIELVFGFESTSSIKLQARSSLLKLGQCIHDTISDFEATIRKNSSKSPVLGGGIHPLTRSAMNCISSLAAFDGILSTIIADYPLSGNSPLPESYFEGPNSIDGPASSLSVYLAWLVLVLLCKLDRKAEAYKDVALAYLFLTNNLHFIVQKVNTTNLKYLLSDNWVSRHTKKVKQYASSYETMAWTKVLSSLPEKGSQEISPEIAMEHFSKFNTAFEEAYRKQASWIVEEGKLRDELKVSIANKLVPVYQEFYSRALPILSDDWNLELLVRFSPDDLGNYLSDLFHGTTTSGSSTSLSLSSLLQSQGCRPR